MQNRVVKLIIRHSLWVSLLLHFLMVLNFSFLWVMQPTLEKSPEYYVPSYTTRGPAEQNTPQPQQQTSTPREQQEAGQKQKPLPKNKNGTEKIGTKQTNEMPSPNAFQAMGAVASSASHEEPVHLVGEEKVAKPLILLLGKALSAHLKYPKTAVDFNIRGTSFVGFILHPDGTITDVKLVQSSGTGVLDKEALHGMTSMAPALHVDKYLKASEYLIVGVIFG